MYYLCIRLQINMSVLFCSVLHKTVNFRLEMIIIFVVKTPSGMSNALLSSRTINLCELSIKLNN